MSLVALITLSAFNFQAAAAPASPPDRSGEPALKQVMASLQKLDNAHLVIVKESRENSAVPMYPESRVDFWLSGKKFRLETSGYWGDGSVVVSDGQTVLRDPLNEYEPAELMDAKGAPLATLLEIKVPLEDMSPLFSLMAGPDTLDKVVEKTTAIKQKITPAGDKELSFWTKKLGSVMVLYHDQKGQLLVDRIEFDNRPMLEEQFKKYPEWADPPQDGALTRNEILVSFEKLQDSLFATKPPKGRAFEDKRRKKAAGS